MTGGSLYSLANLGPRPPSGLPDGTECQCDGAATETMVGTMDDLWTVDGSNIRITNRGHANRFFVLVKTDPNAKSSNSISGFLVVTTSPKTLLERSKSTRADFRIPGSLPLKTSKFWRRYGERQWCGEVYEPTHRPHERIGECGGRVQVDLKAFDIARRSVASGPSGQMQRAPVEATNYVQDREREIYTSSMQESFSLKRSLLCP